MMEIKISDITFVDEIKESDASSVFRVRWHGKECVMKVCHGYEPSGADPPNREIDVFKCESQAYTRLKEKGLCERGLIPDFYGVIKQIDPMEWQPHLKGFLKDRLRPNAILIEYIPNIRKIDLSNFSREKVLKLRQILTEIHEAGVCHGDLYPRNMMVQDGSEKALWIDFDCAQTFSPESVPPYLQEWVEEENEMMDYFVDALTEDHRDGKIKRTWICYYEYVRCHDGSLAKLLKCTNLRVKKYTPT